MFGIWTITEVHIACVSMWSINPGVFAELAKALSDHNVSMESVLQRSRDPDQKVPVVMTTHETEEADMRKAIAQIASSDWVVEDPVLIRIEAL